METTASKSHQQRKMQAKLQKRQRIEQSGGIRPRPTPTTSTTSTKKDINAGANEQTNVANVPLSSPSSSPGSNFNKDQRRDRATSSSSKYRFGRVMEHVPCRNVPRFSTLSIAIPSSILYNCQTRELKTLLCGQIARAATIYHVDEIIIYNDGTTKSSTNNHFGQTHSFERYSNKRRRDDLRIENDVTPNGEDEAPSADPATAATTRPMASDPQIFMARILQYCECPQYLRKHFFPIHSDLQFTGLLAPIDAPHHVRADDRCKYREGVVLQQQPTTTTTDGSLVNCGIRNRPVLIDQRLQPGIRCTVELDPAVYGRPGQIHGKVVSPSTITHSDGTYWGYTVRIASSMKAIFDECPYPLESGGYDLTIGTSERGNENIDDPNFSLQQRRINKSSGSYRHALIVFGGVAGIEESIDADESMPISGSLCQNLFDKWINICPYQGSRTIRSEEAVLIALAKLSPLLTKSAQSTSNIKGNPKTSSSDLLHEQNGYSSGKLPFEDDEKLSEESSDEDNN